MDGKKCAQKCMYLCIQNTHTHTHTHKYVKKCYADSSASQTCFLHVCWSRATIQTRQLDHLREDLLV